MRGGLLCMISAPALVFPAAAAVTTTQTITVTGAATATATETFTLPTGAGTITDTLTTSETVTTAETFTLPTATAAQTQTFTMPTRTATYVPTRTRSLPKWESYAGDLQPAVFREGQEVRMVLRAKQGNTTVRAFDVLANGTLSVRLYEYKAAQGLQCDQYSGTPLYETAEFGVASAERGSGHSLVAAAYVTFTAPVSSTQFIICFRHAVDTTEFLSPLPGQWQIFNVSSTAIFQAEQGGIWYHIPDPTAGQYAIVQLLRSEQLWNYTFIMPSTACSPPGSLASCGQGDNLKIVPAGVPCTEEQQSLSYEYLGTSLVSSDGQWQNGAAGGLLFGAGGGGVGRFGTQTQNPFVSSWTSAQEYASDNDGQAAAYVYVRLPQQIGGSFEVCYSSLDERETLLSSLGTLESVPVWHKLKSCPDGSTCSSAAYKTEFSVAEEPVGWTMHDLTPNTWGTIVFSDNSSGLSTKAATKESATAYNYWAPSGGDSFRIVPFSSVTEEDGVSSEPGAGCWSSATVTAGSATQHGGLAEAGAALPAGSYDLTGGPFGNTTSNHDGQKLAFSGLYVPGRWTRWMVCYRRTCSGGGCKASSGWRVLPWHGRDPVPSHMRGLTPSYHPPQVAGRGAAQLVPFDWGADTIEYPPELTWFMNDTRQGTWGPVIIDQRNLSYAGRLDSRQWSVSGADARGSALRLVHPSFGCDWAGAAAESSDGGAVECNSKSAETDRQYCMGSAADSERTTTVAFYITVPPQLSGGYRVCFRLGAWNWVEAEPAESSSSWLAPTADPLQSQLSLLAIEDRAGMDALFIVTDSLSTIVAAPREDCPGGCDASGDVLRLVPSDAMCDINPSTWSPQQAAMADTHLSMYCPVPGTGTTARSGLVQLSNCAKQPQVVSLAADSAVLARVLSQTPDMFDDIVFGPSTAIGLPAAAAMIRLPSQTPGQQFKVCYKQLGTSNWVTFNDTWTLAEGTGASITAGGSPLTAGRTLLGGEQQEFSIRFPTELPANPSRKLYAKLVPVHGDPQAPRSRCLAPAGGTESVPHASATTVSAAGATARDLKFRLVVPHAPGTHDLCVQVRDSAEDSMSWWRAAEVKVQDNGVRWYVTSGNEPTNQGLVTVNLIRGTGSFNTAKDKDAAKVVTISSPCSSGEYTDWGASEHVGVPRLEHPTKGITDLGPADGRSNEAMFKVTLPKEANNAATGYKVCVMTEFSGRQAWVELQQADSAEDQVKVLTSQNAPLFITVPAAVSHWNLDVRLSPKKQLYVSSTVKATNLALAGAATTFVKTPGSAGSGNAEHQVGFSFTAYSGITLNATTDRFKLVLSSGPVSDANWAAVQEWETAEGANCDGPAVVGNVDCSGSGCPAITSSGEATFHIPIEAGQYIVCYRRATGPWLTLESGAGDTALYAQPTFLQFDADEASAGEVANVSVFDVHTVTVTAGNSTTVESLATWCSSVPGQGVDCAAVNGAGVSGSSAYDTDLLTVVRDVAVCPTPAGGPNGVADRAAGEPVWYRLQRSSNASMRVERSWTNDTVRFALPPVGATWTGPWKLCVYKAGTSDGFDGAVVKSGVVYQLHNRGTMLEGGTSGYWLSAESTRAGALKVQIAKGALEYNESQRFVVADSDTKALFGNDQIPDSLLTDKESGQLSRTPLVDSGSVVSFSVSVVGGTYEAPGTALPFGAYAVDVLRCATAASWDDLSCKGGQEGRGHPPDTAGPFNLRSVGGSCEGEDAEEYGWPETGLRAFLSAGQVSFDLQYLSGCGDSPFGCGVVFRALPPGATTPIYSRPHWINVRTAAPNRVSLQSEKSYEGKEITVDPQRPHSTAPCTVPACYKATCTHRENCVITVRARRGVAFQGAATGKVRVGFAQQAYPSVRTPGVVTVPSSLAARVLVVTRWSGAESPWKHGVYEMKAKFALKGDEDTVLAMNLTFGEGTPSAGWTLFQINVVRPAPTKFQLSALLPLDTADGLLASPYGAKRTPAPAFSGELSADRSELTARQGSYVEALVPYELVYAPMAGDGEVAAGAADNLLGWTVNAAVTDGGNAVLTVHHEPFGDLEGHHLSSLAQGRPTPLNLATVPAAQSPMVARPLTTSGRHWYVRFRMKNNMGCSRFTGGGCTITFSFAKQGSATQTARVRTPVRVIATTLEVVRSSTPGSVANSQGVEVSVYPATPCGVGCVLYDEFHYGDIFALLSEPGSLDGVATRDQVTQLLPASDDDAACSQKRNGECVVGRFAPRELSGKWGARWTVRTSKPCMQCSLTFHSTWGAGPLGDHGTLKVSLADEELKLVCANSADPQVTVKWARDFGSSSVFTVETAVKTAQDAAAEWPRWWVTAALETDGPAGYSLEAFGADGKAAAPKMQLGEGAKTTFSLALKADDGNAPTADVSKRLTFRAMSHQYSSAADAVGTWQRATKELSCSVSVTAREETVGSAVTVIRGTRVRPRPECAETAGCAQWEATVEELTSGIQLMVQFKTTDGAVDVTPRNTTAVAGPTGSTPAGTWTSVSTATQQTGDTDAQAITLESAHQAPVDPQDGVAYTYGKLRVHFMRPARGTVAGEAYLGLKYSSGATTEGIGWPCRKAQFQICGSRWIGGAETVESATTCALVELWIAPSTVSKSLAIVARPSAGSKAPGVGGDASCGGGSDLLTFTAAVYYTLPSVANTRFVVYDTNITYTLSIPGQLLVPSADLKVTNSTLALTADDGLGTLSAYGINEIPAGSPVAATVTAAESGSGAGAAISQTTQETYSFVRPAADYASFSLDDAVTEDPECPSKRTLPSTKDGYRVERGPPGKGWSYSAGAATNVPIPVQARVLTTAGKRAWTYPSVSVAVSKHSWSGCNDGGTMDVYRLAPSAAGDTAAPRSSGLDAADGFRGWQAGSGTGTVTVPSNAGAAVAWVRFKEPCQSCTLQVQLCYTTASTPAQCLESPSSEAADTTPLFGDRSKFTKPFSVAEYAPDMVHVRSQSVPHEDGVVKVGKVATVELEYAKAFGDWAMTAASRKVWEGGATVSAVWAPDDKTDYKYGNGGFLAPSTADQREEQSGQDVTGCSPVGSTSMARALASVLAEPNAKQKSLHFIFTRPCSGCKVHVNYRVGDKTGSIALRSEAGASEPLLLQVRTCATSWMLAGSPPRRVRRAQPFSLTAWRVDGNNLPDWDADGSAAVDFPSALSIDGANNGGGGSPEVTSVADGATKVAASGGSATMRMHWPRACYRCKVKLGGEEHDHAVLTHATRILAFPQESAEGAAVMKNGTDAAAFGFHIYAADELGDRAYTAAGPTEAALQSDFATRRVAPRAIGVAEPSVDTLAGGPTAAIVPVERADPSAPGSPVETVVDGRPTKAEVTQGGSLLNGIPFDLDAETDAAPAGSLVVTLRDAPASNFPVAFMGFGDNVGTYRSGTSKAVHVDFTVAPTKMAVEDAAALCPNAVTGSSCPFRAFAIGPSPKDLSGKENYLSVLDVAGEAKVEATCSPGGCGVTLPNASLPFRRGVASFPARFTGQPATGDTCNCQVTVTPPTALADAAAQVLSLTYQKAVATEFTWAGSDTIAAGNAPASVANRSVTLRITSMSGEVPVAPEWAAGAQVAISSEATTPPGCFSAAAGAISADNTEVTFQGSFGGAGDCTIPASAVTGLPIPVSGDLVVKVQEAGGLRVRQATVAGVPIGQDFGGLTGLADGYAAAVAGVGATLEIEVVDKDDKLVEGDYHTEVTLAGWLSSDPRVQEAATVTVSAGVAQFTPAAMMHMGQGAAPASPAPGSPLPDGGPSPPPSNETGPNATNATEAPASSPAAGSPAPPAGPATARTVAGDWYYNLSAAAGAAAVGVPPAHSVGRLSRVGPLPVVRQATEVRVTASHHSGGGWGALSGKWVAGYWIYLRLAAVCPEVGVETTEDCAGGDASLLFHPGGIPCAEADRAADVRRGCVDRPPLEPQSCMPYPLSRLPACGNSGWTLQNATNNVIALTDGVAWAALKYEGLMDTAAVMLRSADLAGGAEVSQSVHMTLQRPAAIKVTPNATRPALGSPLTLFVQLVDAAGKVVTADSVSRMRLLSDCGEGAAYVGQYGADGQLDVVTVVEGTLSEGEVSLQGLHFSGPCKNMSITVQCAADPAAGNTKCEEFVATVELEVATVDGVPPPELPPASAPIVVGMNLGRFKARAAFDSWLQGVKAADFGSALTDLLGGAVQQVSSAALSLVCAVPSTRVADGISAADRDGTATDGGFCKDFTTGDAGQVYHALAQLRRALVQQNDTELVARAEFKVLISENAAGIDGALLADKITQAIQADIGNANGILRRKGGAAFSKADAADLGLQATVSTTPVPTDKDGNEIPSGWTPAPTPNPPDPPEEVVEETPSPTTGRTPAPPTVGPTPIPDDAVPLDEPISAGSAAAQGTICLFSAATAALLGNLL
eukprot:TRINITY_DN3081_c1_g2_i1.p1 TRINITY_DN3081_c1_g2~~TRINITY_DN3081_c1_g2_i1.p1  ORF type:complete len:4381 (+),score=1060.94 TRINITY_DN3081_c1_g2_i1:147-13289(+)